MAAGCLALGDVGCHVADDLPPPVTDTSSIDLQFSVDPSLMISRFDYEVTGGALDPGSPIEGSIDVSAAGATVSLIVGGLLPGVGYHLSLGAMSDDRGTFCGAEPVFDVAAGHVTKVDISMICLSANSIETVVVDGVAHACPRIASYTVAQSADSVTVSASAFSFEASPPVFSWEASDGTLSSPGEAASHYACGADGAQRLRVTVSDGTCDDVAVVPVTCPFE